MLQQESHLRKLRDAAAGFSPCGVGEPDCLTWLSQGFISFQVPTSAANFVELEALRWENRKLSEAKATAETEVGTWAWLLHVRTL